MICVSALVYAHKNLIKYGNKQKNLKEAWKMHYEKLKWQHVNDETVRIVPKLSFILIDDIITTIMQSILLGSFFLASHHK